MRKAILSGIVLALLPLLGAQQFQVGQHRYVPSAPSGPVYVTGSYQANGSFSGHGPITLSETCVSGETLVIGGAVVYSFGAFTVTATGNTVLSVPNYFSDSGANSYQFFYISNCTVGATTISVSNASGNEIFAFAAGYTGLVSHTLDQYGTGAYASSSAPSCSTSATSGDLVVGLITTNNTLLAFSGLTAGYNTRSSHAYGELWGDNLSGASSNTMGATIMYSGSPYSAPWACMMASFK